MSRKGFAKLIPKAGRVSFTFLLPPEVIWCPPMLGVWDTINLSGNLSDWQIITSMHMYTVVSLFTTIGVVMTNTEMWKVHNVCLCGGGRYVWAQINQSELTTKRSAWPKCWPNVKLTWCSTSSWAPHASTEGEGVCLTWDQTELTRRRSAWPKWWQNVKVTWCSMAIGHQMPLWGYVLAQINLTQDCATVDHQRPLLGGSIRHKLVLLLSTRCLYLGVHLSSDHQT